MKFESKSKLLLIFILAFVANYALSQQPNPFRSIGKKAEVMDLSKGKYFEIIEKDSLERIGSVIINRHTRKIEKFVDEPPLVGSSDNSQLSRFFSVDPIANKYPELTPYQFASNTPIQAIDLDGAEAWYYYDANFGWQQSKLFSGPYKAEYANQLGYVGANQISQIEEERARKQQLFKEQKEREHVIATVEAWNNYQTTRNIFYPFYALSPLKSGLETYRNIENEEYGSASFNLLFTIVGLSELRGFNLFGGGRAASMTWDQIWGSTNFIRGSLAEYKLAGTVYKGFEHLAKTVSEFFPAIDFYKDGLGVSLKTVNASKNFDFKNIIKNIDQLAAAKSGGALQAAGIERKITDVRLDIVVPKGYDKSVLKEVERHAQRQKVNLKIFEAE